MSKPPAARATGGVRFVTALDENGEPLVGVCLSPGSGSWETLSDRNAKMSIRPVDERQILEKLMGMSVSTWQYKGQSEVVPHIGPMAQDFYAAFGMGRDEHYISSVDADGVALASVQGLYQLVQEKDARIAALEKQTTDQEKRLDDFESRLMNLEKGNSQLPSQPYALWFGVMSLIVGLVVGRFLQVPRRLSNRFKL